MADDAGNIDETHDPEARSWVDSANDPATDFPIQNLPFALLLEPDADRGHFGVVIGDRLFALHNVLEVEAEAGLEWAYAADAVMRMSRAERTKLRGLIFELLNADASAADRAMVAGDVIAVTADHRWQVPFPVENYTDFYASIHHASTVGSMFRPDNPLLPNYKWVPIGYHGRASSITMTDTPIVRPFGQTKADDAAAPTFGPCKMLDHELEVGVVIAGENDMGDPVGISRARERMLGLTLVNDWSARDVQKWEYQPLGPFLAKNFATTVGSVVVSMEALEPFRCPAYRRPDGDPRPLPHLFDETDQSRGGFDITLEVRLQSAKMAAAKMPAVVLSRSNAFKDMYWTFAQMIAHHTSNGCNLLPGDLLASGTVSGPESTSRGCMLELTWDGSTPDGKPRPRKPITLPTGESRTFLADGDTVELVGWCEKPGFKRIGFGSCSGTIAAARA